MAGWMFFAQYKPVSYTHLSAASQISDTHGAGIGLSFNLSEGLHLKGAGEGYQGGGKHVQVPWDEANQKQQDDLYQKDSLAPVKASGIAEFFLNAFR